MSIKNLLKSSYSRDFIIKDKKLPSANRIGGILKASGDISNIPKYILLNAQKRGIWVHDVISRIIYGESRCFNLDWDGFIDGFLEFNEKYKPIYKASEYCFYNKTLGAKGIADAICLIDNRLTIIDFKTSSSLNLAAYDAQLQIYALLLQYDKNFMQYDFSNLQIADLQITKRGTFKYYKFNFNYNYANSLINVYKHLIDIRAIHGK